MLKLNIQKSVKKLVIVRCIMAKYNEYKNYKSLLRNSAESIEFYNQENEASKIPEDERIRQHCLWLMEVYPPESINNLITRLVRLNWDCSIGLSLNPKISDIVKKVREQNSYSWHNLGHVIPPNSSFFLETKESNLPEGVKCVKLTMAHFLGSFTILVFQFKFIESYTLEYEKAINKYYPTYTKRIKKGVSYVTPFNQKLEAIINTRQQISMNCINWIKTNLPGYYTSNELLNKMPICEFITLDKQVPFENKIHFPMGYIDLLKLAYSQDAWISEDLDGMFFTYSNLKDGINPYMLLVGKNSDILKDMDLKHYGSNRSEQLVNYLKYFDGTLVNFCLFFLHQTCLGQVSNLRDDLSNIIVKQVNKANSHLFKYATRIAKLDSFIPYFSSELKKYCESKKFFLHNSFTFYKNNKKENNQELLNIIRQSLIDSSDSLLTIYNNVRQSFDTTSKIVNSISNEKLSKNSLRLQIAILIFAIITLLLNSSVISILNKLLKWIISNL